MSFFVCFLFASACVLMTASSSCWEWRFPTFERIAVSEHIWTFTRPGGNFLGECHEKFLKIWTSTSVLFMELFISSFWLPLSITGFKFYMNHTWFFLSFVFHQNTSKYGHLSYLPFPFFYSSILSTDLFYFLLLGCSHCFSYNVFLWGFLDFFHISLFLCN